jgi:GNAT superfamily N-acetyltransferase
MFTWLGRSRERTLAEYSFSTHICISQQEVEDTESDVLAILEGLGKNILKHLGNVELGKAIRVFLREGGGRVVGGATANVFGGWVYISLLWVEDSLRNRGHGTELMNRIEAEAMRLGCRHAHLDTFSFEAKPFYERLGYEVFGVLENYPEGHCKYFLKKRLAG